MNVCGPFQFWVLLGAEVESTWGTFLTAAKLHSRLCLRTGRVVVMGPALEPDSLSLSVGATGY